MTEQIVRSSVESMDALIGKSFPVHNLGFVRVVDYMGSDEAIVQMARTSYGKGTKAKNEDRGLIRYLMKHRHTSPFEGAVLKLHLKMPIFVARQWVRHRTASLNEYSARYSEVKDEFFIPTLGDVQGQSKSNKQGSEGQLDRDTQSDFINMCEATAMASYANYKGHIEDGVARELARINLPLTSYTEMYWQMNLHNLLHFCKLRSDPHAQKEIRAYSDVILHEVVKQWTPLTYEAFIDYVMEAETFSKQEMEVIRGLFQAQNKTTQGLLINSGNHSSQREVNEFSRKLGI